MDKFKNKYRITSARASWWNYGWAGAYFITICTQNREHFFGEIENDKMILSPCGVLADVFWHEIKNHAKNVELGTFVVISNHIHEILILNGNADSTPVQTFPPFPPRRDVACNVSTITDSITIAITIIADFIRVRGKYFAKIQYRFNHYPFLQIGHNQTRQPIGH